ncbi:hypothetical protein ACTND9_16195, partial [Paenibacillus barengoltzii]|uniref:hypothetical protein n=1 Tax=Paenibacillus barengoltzii TaxID=343517 RepID=UPI003F88AEB4
MILTALNVAGGLALGPVLAWYGRRLVAKRGLLRASSSQAARPQAEGQTAPPQGAAGRLGRKKPEK